MAIGVTARTAFSLLMVPLTDEFGWDRGTAAGAFTFGFLVSAALSPIVGRAIDAQGPRIVILVGIALTAAGLAGSTSLERLLVCGCSSKERYYEAIAGAAAACEPGVSDPNLENTQLAHAAAEAALKIVKLREHQAIPDNDQVGSLITDAYATVAIAYRRASAAYTANEDMQQLGTAAVHLLTIATSYIAAQPNDAAQK